MSERIKTVIFLIALFAMFVAGSVIANLIKAHLGW